jgi:hypothetical protein
MPSYVVVEQQKVSQVPNPSAILPTVKMSMMVVVCRPPMPMYRAVTLRPKNR